MLAANSIKQRCAHLVFSAASDAEVPARCWGTGGRVTAVSIVVVSDVGAGGGLVSGCRVAGALAALQCMEHNTVAAC